MEAAGVSASLGQSAGAVERLVKEVRQLALQHVPGQALCRRPGDGVPPEGIAQVPGQGVVLTPDGMNIPET